MDLDSPLPLLPPANNRSIVPPLNPAVAAVMGEKQGILGANPINQEISEGRGVKSGPVILHFYSHFFQSPNYGQKSPFLLSFPNFGPFFGTLVCKVKLE